MKLFDLYKEHEGRECGKWEHYFELYDRYFQKFIGKEVTIFEIGVCHGGSLQIWKKYFGDKCKVIGIDIDEKTKFSEEQISVEIGHQCNSEFWENVINTHGTPDIIIDDGSHIQIDVFTTLSFLYSALNDGGVYVVEDTHTAYRNEYMGSINSPFNIVSILSKQSHDVNTEWITEPYAKVFPDLKSLSFYNSMIFIEKQKNEKSTPFFAGKKEEQEKVKQINTPSFYDWGTNVDSTFDWK